MSVSKIEKTRSFSKTSFWGLKIGAGDGVQWLTQLPPHFRVWVWIPLKLSASWTHYIVGLFFLSLDVFICLLGCLDRPEYYGFVLFDFNVMGCRLQRKYFYLKLSTYLLLGFNGQGSSSYKLSFTWLGNQSRAWLLIYYNEANGPLSLSIYHHRAVNKRKIS